MIKKLPTQFFTHLLRCTACIITVGLWAAQANAQIAVSGGTGLAATYTSLTNAGGLFAALNGTTQTGNNIIVTITADVTTEAGTNSLNQGAWATLSIKPSGARTISGAAASGTPLINLNGADNVTINGLNTGGNSLALSNSTIGIAAGSSTIRFIADATNNTVTNCTILGATNTSYATAGATILFGSGITTGNDNNTISNNDIGPAAGGTPSKAVMGLSSATIKNDNVTITGNNIHDFFQATKNTAGIYGLTGSDGWTISNNKFYQTATRTFTSTALRYSGIAWSNSTGACTISGNTIGFASAAGTGTTTINGSSNEFRGIDVEATSAAIPYTSIQGNTISGINQTSSRASSMVLNGTFIGIICNGACNIGNTTGNAIGSLNGSSAILITTTASTGTPSVQAILDANSVAGNAVSNNTIGAITINSGGTGTVTQFWGIEVSTTAGVAQTINNNIVGGTGSGAISNNIVGDVYNAGILIYGADATVVGNTVQNITGNSNFIGGGTILDGIYLSGNTGANTVSNNLVYGLANNSGTGDCGIVGIHFDSNGTTNTITGNTIHSLAKTGATGNGFIVGLYSPYNGASTIANNMIRLGFDATGVAITLPVEIDGIYEDAGGINSFYFNSVYIGGTGILATGTPAATTAFYSFTTSGTRSTLNNLFINARSNAAGGGTHYAIYRDAATTGLTSNYNDIYAPGTGGVLGYYAGTSYPTLAAYRTASAQEANSISADPQFIAPAGSATTGNLHIVASGTVPNPVESAGTTVTGYTTDIDGQVRPGPAGSVNLGAFAPDIGADEVDASPCSIVEINLQGNGANIIDGQTTPATGNATDFGTLAKGTTITKTYTIQNTGVKALAITGSSVTGTDAAVFSISNLPSSVAAGGNATFNVTFAPTAPGSRTAAIHIANVDCDEADYDFAVQACAPAIAASNQSLTQDVSDNSFEGSGCTNLIANVLPSGGSPVSGNVTAAVTIDGSVQSFNGYPYVQRHYDIDPATGAATATGTVTLYFTQAEFDAYNAATPGTALPSNSADAAGISNLRITQCHGTSATGVPGTYTGTTVTIDPTDANIVWNSFNNRWEITFDVTGFSGFFASGSASIILEPSLLSFTGTCNDGYTTLNWETASEQSTADYVVQRSDDGISFLPIGMQAATGTIGNAGHTFNDSTLVFGYSYYRLQIEGLNGETIYSFTIRLHGKSATTTIYPNPVQSGDKLQVSTATDIQGWKLINSLGQAVRSGTASSAQLSISTRALVPGTYMLLLKTAEGTNNYNVQIK